MYAVALEEHLLLEALRGLYNGSTPLPSAITMASRNDIIDLACTWLSSYEKQLFTRYATEISCLSHRCMVDFPPPPVLACHPSSPAEDRANAYLSEGSGSLWTAVRETVSLLRYTSDPRGFAQGSTFSLGAYRKGGIVGLCRETTGHPATCRLLNTAIIAINRSHTWTSIAVNWDNCTEPHVDRHNDCCPSLLLGLSHHNAGELWLADQNGSSYKEISDSLMAGNKLCTSASGILFDGHQVYHATCPWSEGHRVILVAYSIQSATKLLPDTKEFLAEIGFVLPYVNNTLSPLE